MKIYKEKAGIISEYPIWIILHEGYLYESRTLFRVLWLFITEYKHDKHLVG